MRYLVLSDIHANLTALEAVLELAGDHGYDAVLFLGDVVGYGNRAEESVQLLKSLRPVLCLQGNHDALLLAHAAGSRPAGRPTGIVETVIKRHAAELSNDSLEFLRGFQPAFVGQHWQAVHGGLRSRWEYINSLNSAQANEPFLERDLCLTGHTHVPVVYASVSSDAGTLWRTVRFQQADPVEYRVPPRARVFFNPGSVGQPRDGNPLASFGFFDTDLSALEVHRVVYDVAAVQASLQADDYPAVLAARLADGT